MRLSSLDLGSTGSAGFTDDFPPDGRFKFSRPLRDRIAALLELWRDKSRQSSEVRRIASNHIATLEDKIRDMQDMAATLRDLVQSCRGDHRAECPILERLETDPPDEDLTIRPRSGAV